MPKKPEPVKPDVRMALTADEILQMMAFVRFDVSDFRRLFNFLASWSADQGD